MGNVPTWTVRPLYSTPFGVVGSPSIPLQEDKKCLA